MANRRKNSILIDQAISKPLNSRSVEVPKNSTYLHLLHSTTQKSPHYANIPIKATGQATRQQTKWQIKNNPSAKRSTKITTGKVLLLIAWILLVLNILAVMGNLKYGLNLPLSLHAIENTNDFLFQIGLLAFSAFILSWTSWLYLKNRAGETLAVPILIIIALAVTLSLLTKEPGDVINNVRGLGRTLSCSFPTTTPVTTTPMYRLVTGILYSEDKPSAVVGSQIVHEGDTLCGVNVVKIYKNKVEFEKSGKRWTQLVE